MTSLTQSKSMAKALRSAMADRGVGLSHSACLEIVARQFGCGDWNTLHARQLQQREASFILFVQHGREGEARTFYEAAFETTTLREFDVEGALAGFDLKIGNSLISVCGSNPNRERQPDRGGPFSVKSPGAVSAMVRIETSDIQGIMNMAVRAGATIRDPVQTTANGPKAGSLFDPFGHIWVLQQL